MTSTSFRATSAVVLRAMLLMFMAAAIVGLDAHGAYAQSANCARLAQSLASLEQNGQFRSRQNNSQQLRSVSTDLQRAESTYVRTGCNDLARRGQPLPRQCQDLARRILSARDEVAALSRQVDTGDAVAQQREAILQESARFRCNTGSSATVNRQANRGNFFEQLFGGFTGGGADQGFDGGGGIRGEEFRGYGSYHTVRTLCVRKSDGYYWPISYSTLAEYASNDAAMCAEQCPGVDVELYMHDNPGQTPEQMRNLFGEPYSSLPNAFKYRTAVDLTNSCRPQTYGTGTVTTAQTETGQTRSTLQVDGRTVPLPVRDPRGRGVIQAAAIDPSQFVSVPLPRRRPHAPGEDPPAMPIASANAAEPMRLAQFGEKTVRIVGPDTPYAPTAAAGT
ncbi:MAG: DUF2865 domain-containing protein [Devosia sp.]